MGGKTGNALGRGSDELVDMGVENTQWYTYLQDLLKNISGVEEGLTIALVGRILNFSGIGLAVGGTYVGMKTLDDAFEKFAANIREKTGGKWGNTYQSRIEDMKKRAELKKKEDEKKRRLKIYDTRFSTSLFLNDSSDYLTAHEDTLADETKTIANAEPIMFNESINAIEGLENESAKLKSNIDDLSVSVGDKLNPKVKDLAESVKQLDEATNIQDQAARYIYGQFGLDESGMPLGGLPKREDFLVGGQMLSVTESEKEGIEGIQGGIKKQIDVLNNVADGLDMVGYDLKGVGNFATTIEQLTLASKLDHPDFDKTKAYVAGISSLFKGIGANIGGNVGSALSSMGNMAASGASIGSAIAPGGTGAVVGAVVGGAVGLISSIFGGDDKDEQEEAARERMRQQIYQGMLSRSLSGSGPYSLKMLRESNWDYDKLKKQFGNKDEEELIKYQNRLELLDDIGASLEQIGSPEIVRSIDQVRAKYEYAAKSVKGMLDIASAEMTEISAQVFGLTADNLVSMFDSAIETAEDAGHAGRLIAEALELQIVDSFKKLAISQAINEAVMPMLQPILNELVAGALSGGLSPGEMADLVLQAQEIAASVAPAVSSLYGAFDEAGVLNYSYSSTPFESQGSYNGPVITGGTGVASGQQNDTRGDRPVQVVVQVANHEFETMVTELADNVFVRAERRKGVVNAQKVFG